MMTKTTATDYLGVGIYTVPEAARLSGVSARRIRRWIRGYSFGPEKDRRFSPRVWQPELPKVDEKLALGFRDLMEVRFVDAFRRQGVSWRTLRRVAEKAAERFGVTHPFTTLDFKTDGRTIFISAVEDSCPTDTAGSNEKRPPVLMEKHSNGALYDFLADQRVFEEFIRPYLVGLQFDDQRQPFRWFPLGEDRRVLIDPRRSFGRPIVVEGVPTAVLSKAIARQSAADVARWYEVAEDSVEDAREYEATLPAAA